MIGHKLTTDATNKSKARTHFRVLIFEGIDRDVTIGPDFYVTSSSHSTSGVWVRQFAPNRDDTSAKRSDLSRTIMGPAVKGLAAVQSKVD